MNLYETWLVNQPIAHRGLHDEISPENSLSAFEKAVQHHYAIETDVHLSKDGVIVVFHDDTVDRMTDGTGVIEEKTLAEIKALTLKNSAEKIPTFDEFLSTVGGRTPILVEIKNHKNIGVLETQLTEKLNAYGGDFAVQSFHPFIVKWFKKNAPHFLRGQLSTNMRDEKDMPAYQKKLLTRCFFNFMTKPHFVSYDVRYIHNKRTLKWRKKMPVLMWTTRSEEEMKANKDYFDNIIFEHFLPDVKE